VRSVARFIAGSALRPNGPGARKRDEAGWN
jgi:hypothetical protein